MKPQTIDALKVNITNIIQQIQPDLCEKVIHAKIGLPEYVSPSEAAADIWATLYSILNTIKYSFK